MTNINKARELLGLNRAQLRARRRKGLETKRQQKKMARALRVRLRDMGEWG